MQPVLTERLHRYRSQQVGLARDRLKVNRINAAAMWTRQAAFAGRVHTVAAMIDVVAVWYRTDVLDIEHPMSNARPVNRDGRLAVTVGPGRPGPLPAAIVQNDVLRQVVDAFTRGRGTMLFPPPVMALAHTATQATGYAFGVINAAYHAMTLTFPTDNRWEVMPI